MPVGQNDTPGNPAWIWTNRPGYTRSAILSPGSSVVWSNRQAQASRRPFWKVALPRQPTGGGTDWAQSVDDALGLVDAIAFGYGPTIADTVTPADALRFDRSLTIADTAALADALSLARAIQLADTVSLADAIAFQAVFNLALADSVSLSDALAFFPPPPPPPEPTEDEWSPFIDTGGRYGWQAGMDLFYPSPRPRRRKR